VRFDRDRTIIASPIVRMIKVFDAPQIEIIDGTWDPSVASDRLLRNRGFPVDYLATLRGTEGNEQVPGTSPECAWSR
jgi:hypothetical protein